MRFPSRAVLCGVIALAMAGCTAVFGHQYEYEEQFFFDTNGAARVEIDASVSALAALHGLTLNTSPSVLVTAADVREAFAQAGCPVTRVGNPWRRDGRRFVQVILQLNDVRQAAACKPLAWATYAFGPYDGGLLRYASRIGASAGGDPGPAKWDGSELIAIKLHLPSKITWQNVKRLGTGENGSTERGNILTWEQTLADRRAGQPIDIEVRMEPESILYRTLWLFGGAFVAAVLVLIIAIAWIVRQGRKRARAAHAPHVS